MESPSCDIFQVVRLFSRLRMIESILIPQVPFTRGMNVIEYSQKGLGHEIVQYRFSHMSIETIIGRKWENSTTENTMWDVFGRHTNVEARHHETCTRPKTIVTLENVHEIAQHITLSWSTCTPRESSSRAHLQDIRNGSILSMKMRDDNQSCNACKTRNIVTREMSESRRQSSKMWNNQPHNSEIAMSRYVPPPPIPSYPDPSMPSVQIW